MLVGIGAHQLGRDLGAVNRLAIDAQVAAEHGDVEAGEMEQLGGARIGQHLLQVGGGIFAGGELHGMADAIARRQLRQAQPVAEGVQPQGLGVYGNDGAEVQPVRQVALVQLDLHHGSIAHGPVNS